MKLHRFKDLERDIADKSAYLEKQRQVMIFERIRLKQTWIESITSPPALLLSFSIGFVAAYLRKPKTRAHGRFSQTRAKLQTAIFNSIKRFTSGIVIGVISSITARKGGPLSIAGLEE